MKRTMMLDGIKHHVRDRVALMWHVHAARVAPERTTSFPLGVPSPRSPSLRGETGADALTRAVRGVDRTVHNKISPQSMPPCSA